MYKYLFTVIVFCLGLAANVRSDLVRNETVLSVVNDYWMGQYDSALAKSERMIESDPESPLGYFVRGAIYQSISENFRNDSFEEIIYDSFDRAIELSEDLKEEDLNNPDWYFIAGASYGYRGVVKAFHGSWWAAFKDGLRCANNLEKSIELDSTYYDAYWGLGAYHYYKTVKASSFLWLPFVSDRREQGQQEIQSAIENGYLAENLAREAMLRIHLWEGRHDTLIRLADSLLDGRPNEPYAILYLAEGLIGAGKIELAERAIDSLSSCYAKSEYFDSLGAMEIDLLQARLLHKKGKTEKAKKLLEQIIANNRARVNAYFNETSERAIEFYDKIR